MHLNFLAKLGEFLRSNKDSIVAGEVTEEDIQTAIRNARASSGGKQKAANRMTMAEQFSKDGEWKLFMEQEFSEPPQRIQVLPRPGTYDHAKYGKFTLTSEDIQKFVDNHNAHVYQEKVPIDAEHQSKLSGAVGYYGKLNPIDEGRGGAEAEVEWTERGKSLIASDQFKYFSPEWFDEWSDPATQKIHNNVLIGGALTTRPFFKDRSMRPLVAGPEHYQAGEWVEGEENYKTLMFSEVKFSEADDEPKQANIDTGDVHVEGLIERGGTKKKQDEPAEQKKARESGGKSMEMDEATKAFVEEQVSAQVKGFKEELDTEKGLRQAAETRLASLEQEAQTRRFGDIILGRDGEGDGSPPFAGEHAPHQTMLSLLAKEYGEDSEQFKAYVAQQRAVSKQMREAGLFKETGVGSGPDAGGASTAARRFDDAVTKWLSENSGKTKVEAIKAVTAANPKMYTEYIREKDKIAKTASSGYGFEDDGEDN